MSDHIYTDDISDLVSVDNITPDIGPADLEDPEFQATYRMIQDALNVDPETKALLTRSGGPKVGLLRASQMTGSGRQPDEYQPRVIQLHPVARVNISNYTL